MEQPTIFYAIALTLALMDFGGGINYCLAWGYVGLRVLHSLIQSTVNIVKFRLLVFALASAVPARPDGPRGDAHRPRLRAALAREAGGKLDVGRPAELADRPHPVELEAAVGQRPRVAREGRGVAADIGDALDG